MKCLEESGLYIEKTDSWLPGAGGEGFEENGKSLLMGVGWFVFFWGGGKNVLKFIVVIFAQL